jgi:outer membrane lipoprotein SlyB
MRKGFARSVQFWILVGGAVGGVIDYAIGVPRDWGTGLAIGMAAGAVVGFAVREVMK